MAFLEGRRGIRHAMTDYDSNSAGASGEVTPEMLNRAIRGEASPEEVALVRAAMKDPNSQIHDWLEGVEEWAQRAFRKRSGRASAADRMLREGAARHDYDDVVDYIRNLRKSGKITEREMDTVLKMNTVPQSESGQPQYVDYRGVALRMLEELTQARPDLADEVQQVRTALDRGLDPGQGR